MDSVDTRRAPRFWRHDAYTLNCLHRGIERAIADARKSPADVKAFPTVVDIGAGSAPYRGLFETWCAKYVTCDIDDAERHGGSPNADVKLVPGTEIAIQSNSVDWVVSFQVLEHVWDVDWYLRECNRLLKADGILLLSTHGTWLYHPHPTDYRRWTRDGLCKEIQCRGFDIVTVAPIVGPLAWTTQFRTLAYHHLLASVPVIGKALSAVVCTFMHLRMRIEDAVTPRAQLESNAAVYLVLATVRRPSGD